MQTVDNLRFVRKNGCTQTKTVRRIQSVHQDPMEKPSTLQLIQSHSLTTIIQEEVEKMILRGEISVGGRLNESEMAQRFGISRGPIREAFRGLEESGLVRQEKNRGAFVREISIAEADEIYDLREALEELIGRKLAQRISAEQLAELERQIGHMEKVAASKDATLYHPLNLQFHDTLVSFIGNGKLTAVYRKLTKELLLFRLRSLSVVGGMDVSIEEHREIYQAIAKRDAEKAGAVLRRHSELSRARMHRAMSA
ncbi:phosphonate utilization associated transcriptional regulator [Verminephrobacter eiseniae]|nr:phosphonate utilization associated transcriptional regulator [Verminephrobacter sp. Larva24]MCW5233939.1 phosphonate utilization associated transcriptional regulator [Verminephrobacter eiseniae]MCW5294506.1 phosphonate utilization associated transcriptional regulator [Verminephrobacter eiseniae]MCW8188006.1 phosphonate utilization associated transcriptional regulator [Verminephrobacter eiseniae]MCW8226090.1 phosphonate utilization associated transcriptional regulator [Verminephrobacter eisen